MEKLEQAEKEVKETPKTSDPDDTQDFTSEEAEKKESSKDEKAKMDETLPADEEGPETLKKDSEKKDDFVLKPIEESKSEPVGSEPVKAPEPAASNPTTPALEIPQSAPDSSSNSAKMIMLASAAVIIVIMLAIIAFVIKSLSSA